MTVKEANSLLHDFLLFFAHCSPGTATASPLGPARDVRFDGFRAFGPSKPAARLDGFDELFSKLVGDFVVGSLVIWLWMMRFLRLVVHVH